MTMVFCTPGASFHSGLVLYWTVRAPRVDLQCRGWDAIADSNGFKKTYGGGQEKARLEHHSIEKLHFR